MLPALHVYEQIDAARPTFRIIETFFTSDGVRSRVCEGVWHTREAAMEAWQQRVINLGK